MNPDSYMRFVLQANDNISMILQFYQETNEIMRAQLNQTQQTTTPNNNPNIVEVSTRNNQQPVRERTNNASRESVSPIRNREREQPTRVRRNNRNLSPMDVFSSFLRPSVDQNYTFPFIPSINIPNIGINNQPSAMLRSYGNISRRFGQMNTVPNNFFEPVPVVATQEQINNALEDISFESLDENNNTCPIDQQAFTSDDSIVRIRQCGHCFRRNNIEQWFTSNVTCPICRLDIRTINPINNVNTQNHAEEYEGTLNMNSRSEEEEETNNNEPGAQDQTQDLETMIVNTLSNVLETSLNDISFNGDVNVEYGIFNAQNP